MTAPLEKVHSLSHFIKLGYVFGHGSANRKFIYLHKLKPWSDFGKG